MTEDIEDTEKKLVTKEQILFRNEGGKPLPIEITTLVPVDEEGPEPVYMKLKLIPFLREELVVFNRQPLIMHKEYKTKIDASKSDQEKVELEAELQRKLEELNVIQEKHVVVDRIVEPKFTESDFKLMSRTALDAIYLTVLCASKVPKNLLLRVIGKASLDEAVKQVKSNISA